MTYMSDQAKDSILIASGIINAALPGWVKLLPDATDAIEAVLRLMVAGATLVFLGFRIMYYRKKTKLLTKKNAIEDSDE